MLLDAYERYGPIFTLRLFHGNVVFMLGPAANHYITVSHASNFTWREGALPRPDRPDGRRPADDRRRLPPPLAADHAAGLPPRAHRGLGGRDRGGDRDARSSSSRAGATRSTCTRGRGGSRCAWRCARCSALDPDGAAARSIDAAGLFEEALAFYASDYLLRVFRGRAHPVGADAAGGAQARHADLRRDLPPARDRRARRGHPQPAARRRTTRTATRSATCRSATR